MTPHGLRIEHRQINFRTRMDHLIITESDVAQRDGDFIVVWPQRIASVVAEKGRVVLTS